jgi:hypothetical protein
MGYNTYSLEPMTANADMPNSLICLPKHGGGLDQWRALGIRHDGKTYFTTYLIL